MTTANLSAIFQPGILSHPQHDMAPPEYRLSQDVLIFLIENQDSFLIGMQGTAADSETVRDVQSGSPGKSPATPTTPGRSKTIIGRSGSNASVGAESVGKFGSIRRNMSLSSSKRSKRSDGGPTMVAGVIVDPATPSSGVHRSNTVPSRRGGSNAASPRFPQKSSDPSTPSPGNSSIVAVDANRQRQESLQSTPIVSSAPPFPAAPDVTSASSSEATTPLARVGSDAPSSLSREYQTPKKDTTPLLSPPPGSGDRKTERSASGTPSTTSGRALLDIFKQSPGSDSDGRKPNKLQKKRIPGSALSSAQSSNQSLPHDGGYDAPQRSPITSTFPTTATVIAGSRPFEKAEYSPAQSAPTGTAVQAPQKAPRRISGDNTLRPTISPAQSFNSTAESDADMVGDDLPKDQLQQPEKEKKRHRWRFSRPQNTPSSPGSSSTNPLGTMSAQDQTTSRSTIGSGSAQPRRSFQEPQPLSPQVQPSDPGPGTPFGSPPMPPTQPIDPVFSDSEREKKGGPMSWLRGKFKDGKERESEKRARSPERNRGSRQDLGVHNEPLPTRGKSFEQQRVGPGSGAAGAAGQAMSSQAQGGVGSTGVNPHAVTAAQAALGYSDLPATNTSPKLGTGSPTSGAPTTKTSATPMANTPTFTGATSTPMAGPTIPSTIPEKTSSPDVAAPPPVVPMAGGHRPEIGSDADDAGMESQRAESQRTEGSGVPERSDRLPGRFEEST